MIKLNRITSRNGFAPDREHWDIDDDIQVLITRYDEHVMMSIWHVSGDIADQIYEKIKSIEYFSDLKLGISSNYTIDVPLEKLEKFLQYIEKIDRTTLKEGKCY